MNKLTSIFLLVSLQAFSQDKVIDGIYDKQYVDTYTIVRFNKDKTFEYRWESHMQTINLNGKYRIKGDTIILNSNEPWKKFDSSTVEFKNEKWLFTGKGTIHQNDTIKPDMIYIGTELKRNKTKEKILTKGLKSDLHVYVDSLIKNILSYKPTLDSVILSDLNPNNNPNIIIRDYTDPNPRPLIILDNKVVDIEYLNNYKLTSKTNVEALKDEKALAIWRTRARNGIIVIWTKNGR